MGFVGPEKPGLVEQLGVDLDERGNIARDAAYMTSVPGVFVAGDAGRGQSLIVWAIAEGRAAASAVDAVPHRLDHAALPDPAHRAPARRLTPTGCRSHRLTGDSRFDSEPRCRSARVAVLPDSEEFWHRLGRRLFDRSKPR